MYSRQYINSLKMQPATTTANMQVQFTRSHDRCASPKHVGTKKTSPPKISYPKGDEKQERKNMSSLSAWTLPLSSNEGWLNVFSISLRRVIVGTEKVLIM